MLGRAHGINEREMGGASTLQLKNAESVAEALKIMAQVSAISSADFTKLTALAQRSTSAESDDVGARAGEAYTSQSSTNARRALLLAAADSSRAAATSKGSPSRMCRQ